MDYSVIETESGEPVEAGYGLIDKCIYYCKKYGLNVVIDLHKTKGFSFDTVSENGLFDSEELMDRFVNLWRNIAKRLGGNDNIAFELLNEIVDSNGERWNLLLKRAVEAVREYAPKTPIILGGVQWNSVHTLTLIKKPNDNYIVYNFHFYEPFLFTHQLAPWQPLIADKTIRYPGEIEEYRTRSAEINCFGSGLMNTDKMGAEFMEKLIIEAVEAARNAGVPLYCGEYGVIDRADIDDTLSWYGDINSVFEKYQIGRAAWCYKELDFGITDAHYKPHFENIVRLI